MFNQQSPERKIRNSLTSLLATHSFFGVLALRMPFSPGAVETIAGDGLSLTYNPEWVSSASHDELKGCIAHIVFACALKHHTRRGERDSDKWNRASRIATAELLESQNLWIPDDLSGMDLPIETIYDRLPDPPKNEGGSPPPSDGSGAASADGAGGEGEDSQNDDQQDNQGKGQGDGQSDDGNDPANEPQDDASSGSGRGAGNPEPQDSQGPERAPGEIQDAPEESRDEQDKKWDKASKQALQSAKNTGTDPGDIEQEFDGQHDHRRDWRDLLREYMRAVAPTDYSWSRPNRRMIDSGLYLPSLAGEGMGPLIIAIDTSGSVDDEHVNRACAEIFEIARDVMPERIHVIQCDARVQDALDFDPMMAPDEIVIRGRGGTEFQPVFDYIRDEGLTPDCVIYMTDLGGPMPDEPDYPVIWAVEDDYQESQVPFGQGLVLGKD